MTLKDKIMYCRKKAGMSQEELGEKIGVSRQAISKWETGESTPEVGKLLLLAKTFGVTTDWLLSEDEPIEEEKKAEDEGTPQGNPYYHKTADEKTYPDWLENLPRSFGRFVKRFGWIGGVYISLVGVGITFIGGIVKLVTSLMITGFSSTTDMMIGEMGEMVGGFDYSVAGNGMFSQYQNSVDGMIDNFTKFNPVSILGTSMLVIGVILIIGGIVLAVTLKKYWNDNK